jgi:hypothetical protein
MKKISTGIKGLDNLIDFAHIGDNVVWEVEAGTSEDLFINNFIHSSLKENQDVIYVSFNRSPESIILNLDIKDNPKKLTILDCFTSGKGKSDKTFLKFYEAQQASGHTVIKVNNPGDISFFGETVNAIQDKLPEGVPACRTFGVMKTVHISFLPICVPDSTTSEQWPIGCSKKMPTARHSRLICDI